MKRISYINVMVEVEKSDLRAESPKEWINAVMEDFPAFLQDHANCERKASSMAMSFVAKYPDRTEIIPELLDTAIEELAHFKQVYQLMEQMNIPLPHEIGQDHYVKQLLDACRSGRDERFLDRLCIASIVEYRGAERFRMVYEALPEGKLKTFYKNLYHSEARHGEVFVDMAKHYFNKQAIHERLNFLYDTEARVLLSLPIKPALH